MYTNDQLLQYHLLSYSFPLNCFCTFEKDQMSIFACVCIWTLYYVPLVCVSILTPNALWCWLLQLDNILKLATVIPLTLFFLFKVVLVAQVSLPFHVNFKMSLSILAKILAGILIVMLNLEVTLERIGTLLVSFLLRITYFVQFFNLLIQEGKSDSCYSIMGRGGNLVLSSCFNLQFVFSKFETFLFVDICYFSFVIYLLWIICSFIYENIFFFIDLHGILSTKGSTFKNIIGKS